MRSVIWLLAALTTIGTAPAAVARTQTLEPTSAWTVDYDDEKCSLLRDFGALDGDGLGLRIDSYGSLSSFHMSVIGERVPRPTLKLPTMRVGFALSSDPELREVQALTGTIGDYRFAQFSVTFLQAQPTPPQLVRERDLTAAAVAQLAVVRQPDPLFEASIDSLRLELRRGQDLQLNTGPLAPALRALRTCVDDLRKSWGLDPAQQRAITRAAYPDPAAVKEVMGDFPRTLAMRGSNGFVPLRVMVDANGGVTGCVVQLSVAPEEFREAACANIGSKFTPALGEDGQPVDSFYQTAVIYLVRPF